jgi:hypothetical protein
MQNSVLGTQLLPQRSNINLADCCSLFDRKGSRISGGLIIMY